MPMMAFVNEKLTPLQEAKIPVLDRGFLFGDSLFEVIKVHNTRPVHINDHIRRLIDAAKSMEFHGVPTREVFDERVRTLIRASGLNVGYVYMQISRGVALRRSRVSKLDQPTVVLFTDDSPGPDPNLIKEGVQVITVPDDRALFGEFKTTSAMPRIVAEMQASSQGCYEAIYKDRDGRVFEATAANLFLVKCSTLFTPALDRHVLPGVTREKIINIAGELGLKVRQRSVTYDELLEADEVFLTGSIKVVLGVVKVDGQVIGSGNVGPITKKLRQEYISRFFDGGIPNKL